MKRFIELNETDDYEAGSRCRRERVAGRLELLKAFYDGEPFWMVRLRGLKQADRDYLGLTGNGHWRFLDKGAAEGKFAELADLPKYAAEALVALKLRTENRERALAKVREGKLRPFSPIGAASVQNEPKEAQ
jgi:hypothetical protein